MKNLIKFEVIEKRIMRKYINFIILYSLYRREETQRALRCCAILRWAKRSRVSTERIFSVMVIVTVSVRLVKDEEKALSRIKSQARNCHPVKLNTILIKRMRYCRHLLFRSVIMIYRLSSERNG